MYRRRLSNWFLLLFPPLGDNYQSLHTNTASHQHLVLPLSSLAVATLLIAFFGTLSCTRPYCAKICCQPRPTPEAAAEATQPQPHDHTEDEATSLSSNHEADGGRHRMATTTTSARSRARAASSVDTEEEVTAV